MSWHNWMMQHNPLYKRLYEEGNMCKSRDAYERQLEGEMKAALGDALPKEGSIVEMRGTEYIVQKVGLKYLFTNGDPDTLYARIRTNIHPKEKSEGFIITHKALMREAQAPMVKRHVTLHQLLSNSPCEDGMKVLAKYVGANGHSMYQVVTRCVPAALSIARPVQELYDFAKKDLALGIVPDSWLQFVAVILNLIPKGAKLNRPTLLRLLGIKE